MDCPRAEAYIVEQLRQHLSPTLYYHGLHHTLDVVAQAEVLADAEGVTNPEQRALLRTAALYHDAGFLSTYKDHEEAGCALVRQVLPGFGYSAAQVETVCQLILTTKVPQSPGLNPLAQLLCDADLDYLGRPDFWPISRTLFRELHARQLVPDEHAWNQIQGKFLGQHRYWTRTAHTRREAAKQERLAEVRALLGMPPVPDSQD